MSTATKSDKKHNSFKTFIPEGKMFEIGKAGKVTNKNYLSGLITTRLRYVTNHIYCA